MTKVAADGDDCAGQFGGNTVVVLINEFILYTYRWLRSSDGFDAPGGDRMNVVG